MPNPSHPYTLASRTSPSASQNLPKSMAAQPHRQTADRKHGHTTSCIVHLADSANFKGVTSNKRCSGLTGSCFESPNDTIHVTVMGKLNKRHNGMTQTREPPILTLIENRSD
jgi:hypothetical protein